MTEYIASLHICGLFHSSPNPVPPSLTRYAALQLDSVPQLRLLAGQRSNEAD